MSDKKLIKEITVLTATQAAGQIMNLVALVFLARFLGESDFGMIQVCVAIMSYALIVSETGLFAVGSRAVARLSKLSDISDHVRSQLSLMAMLGVAVFALSILPVQFFTPHNINKTVLLIYMAVTLPQAGMLDWLGIAMGKSITVGISRLVKAGVYLLLILLILPRNSNLNLVPVFLIISMIAGNIVMRVQSWRWLGWWPKPFGASFSASRQLLAETAPIGAANIVQRVLFNFDLVIIGFIATTSNAGVYAAAAKLLFVLIVAVETALSAVLPRLSQLWQDDKPAFNVAARRYLKILLFCLTPLPIIGLLFAEPVIRLIYSGQYISSVPIFKVLIVAYPLLSLVLFLGTVLVASDRQKSWFLVTVTGAIVAIIALLLLIPALGVIGAAWAMLISYVVSLLVAGLLISKAT